MSRISKKQCARIGDISNLITDMTVRGATYEELERAIDCSLAAVDNNISDMDYDTLYYKNNIDELKRKYQGGND